MGETARSCPSARCAAGNLLLGVLEADGHIRHMNTPVPVDAAFVRQARAHGNPEARMRFTSACITSACRHWTGSGCGVIDRVLAQLEQARIPLDDRLPVCPIRGSCRWFGQRGGKACRACSLVATDAPDHVAA